MKLNAQIVLDLSNIFGQLHTDDAAGGIFSELQDISTKCLDAFDDKTKSSRMTKYVNKNKPDYFCSQTPTQKVKILKH